MTATACAVEFVTRHHLVLKSLPKEMHGIFRGLAFKIIEVLNHGVIVGSPFELQTGNPLKTTQTASPLSVVHSPLVGIGV